MNRPAAMWFSRTEKMRNACEHPYKYYSVCLSLTSGLLRKVHYNNILHPRLLGFKPTTRKIRSSFIGYCRFLYLKLHWVIIIAILVISVLLKIVLSLNKTNWELCCHSSYTCQQTTPNFRAIATRNPWLQCKTVKPLITSDLYWEYNTSMDLTL